MLSLKKGGPPPPKTRRPLLALMTPELRSLYEGTVLPLLETTSEMDRLCGVVSSARSIIYKTTQAHRVLSAARAALPCKKEGTKEHAVLQRKVERLEKKIREQVKKGEKVGACADKLTDDMQKTFTSLAAIAAMEESDTPIVTGGSGGGGSSSGVSVGIFRHWEAARIGGAAAAPARASSATEDSKPAAAAPARASSATEDSKPAAAAEPPANKKKKARHAALSRSSIDDGGGVGGGGVGAPSDIVTALLHHPDLAPSILELLRSRSTLHGVGAASRSLRAAVKASLPRLALQREPLYPKWDNSPTRRAALHRQCEETVREGFPRLEEYPRLRHLHVHADLTRAEAAQLATGIAAVGLPARLETLRLVGTPERRWYGNEGGHRALADMLTNPQHAWPRLVMLDAGPGSDVLAFLHAMQAAPAAHCFPRLRALGCEELNQSTGRKLLALLDRGAFPALTALTPSASTGRLPSASVTVNIEAEDEWARPCAVLRRLSDTPSLFVQSTGVPAVAWGPFAQLLVDGGLTNLKRLSLSVQRTPDLIAILAAAGAGELPKLEALDIKRPRYSTEPPLDDDGGLLLPPNSLPCLRELSVERRATPAAVAGLLGAAGPCLSRLELRHATATAGVAAMAREEEIFPWLPSLETLELYWDEENYFLPDICWRKENPKHLSRMPALRTFELRTPEYDEIVVRLLVLADGGRLRRSKDMRIGLPWRATNVGRGVRLLLAFWQKRQMSRALDGAEGAVLWNLPVAQGPRRYFDERASVSDRVLLESMGFVAAARKQLEGRE